MRDASLLARVPVPVLLAVTVFFWGAAFNVTDVALEYTSVGVTAISRPIIAALILLPLLPLIGGRLPRSPRVWVYAAIVGLGATTLALTGLGIGAQTAGPAVTAVLINSAPFFAVLMARVALQEKVKFLRGLGLAVGFLGGREQPDVFIQDQETVGSRFSTDVVTYKVRGTVGVAVLNYRSFVRGNV